ncbi:MAG: hypothetical protein O8C67_15365 [Candidatus Methanoperedens sp.]|nr:hypothetical protein [Candidatus Methanoperedens sp.]
MNKEMILIILSLLFLPILAAGVGVTPLQAVMNTPLNDTLAGKQVLNLEGVNPSVFNSPAFIIDSTWIKKSHFVDSQWLTNEQYDKWMAYITRWTKQPTPIVSVQGV